MASFWSYWIIILTTVTIVGITWILFANRKREQQSTDKTTGHVYDGIEELDNPLPAWWFYMFVITIVWGVGYLIIYPGMEILRAPLAGPRSDNTTRKWPKQRKNTVT